MAKLDHLVVGSCSFTAQGWESTFYPPGLKKSAYLSYYAQQFGSVEVDATFYGVPSEKTVRGWYERTPENFIFACKVPQSITHEACLVDCDDQFREFVNVMSGLEHKLGPMLFQFPYFSQKAPVAAGGLSGAAAGFSAKTAAGISVRNRNSQQGLDRCGIARRFEKV